MNQTWNDWRLHWVVWLFLALAIFLFITQGLLSSSRKSAAFDEQYHLAAGYSYLRTGDFRLATTHPPLMGLLGGAGLLAMNGIVLPLEHPSWAAGDRFLFSDVFLWEANERSVEMLEAARRPIVVLGALLVLVMFIWSRQLLGSLAAGIATVLVVFEPNLVSNARVVATDFGLTIFLFCAMWRMWCWLEEPSWRNILLMGGFAGLAMAAKYTGLLFWPIALIVTILFPIRVESGAWGRRARGLIGAGIVAYIVLWAVYSFDFGWIDLAGIQIPALAPFYWQQLWSTFGGIVDNQQPSVSFLLGEVSTQGKWYYFPVALAVKTPIALLLLVLAGVFAMLAQGSWRKLSVLWIPPLAFFALGMTGIITIGFRHVLPAMPFLIMLASNSATLSPLNRRRRVVYRSALVVLLLWVVVSSLRVYPHQESYFNELAGRWTNWSKVLVDSSLDWGQDLPSLRDKMAEMGIDRVNLGYFGKAVPEKYGVGYHPLPSYLRFVEGYELNAYNPYTPEPGWYAISATSLRLGMMQAETVDLYAYFRDMHPAARAGYSIYLYNVEYPPEIETKRRVIIGAPVASLSPGELGIAPQTRVQAKWTRSDDSGIVAHDGVEPALSAAYVPLGANFADVLILDGYELLDPEPRPGNELALRLYWRRGGAPLEMPAPTRGRPLSAFVQLTEEEPWQVVAQFDGWDTALRGLEPGDTVIQEASLDLPADLAAGEYRLLVGLYSPQSGQRLSIGETEPVADFVEMSTLTVR